MNLETRDYVRSGHILKTLFFDYQKVYSIKLKEMVKDNEEISPTKSHDYLSTHTS